MRAGDNLQDCAVPHTEPACHPHVSLEFLDPATCTAHSLLLPLSHRAGALFLSCEVLDDGFSVSRVATECLENTLLRLLVRVWNTLGFSTGGRTPVSVEFEQPKTL